MSGTERYIVVTCNVVGNERNGFDVAYSWDGSLFDYKKDAVTRAFEYRGSDDFNIGVVRGRRLVSWWWMDSQINEESATLREIERQIGLPGGAS